MKLTTIFTLLIALLVWASCGDKEEPIKYHGGIYGENLIGLYIDCDSLLFTSVDNRIDIQFDGSWINTVYNPLKFDSLAKANNDTEYNSMRIGFNPSINDSISSISIKCDKDIDGVHLAGSELNDLFTFKGETYYTVIQNHYNKNEADRLQMSARDVTPAKTRVMSSECTLTLDTPPVQSGTYTFDVSIKLSKKTLQNTVTMEF